MSLTVGVWVAMFDDGPCADEDRVFTLGPIWHWIELAPISVEVHGWTIVGSDYLGPAEEPWPGQIKYWLTRVEHRPDADPIAHYRS